MESIIDQRPLRVSGGPDAGVGQMWGLLEWVGSCIVAPVMASCMKAEMGQLSWTACNSSQVTEPTLQGPFLGC